MSLPTVTSLRPIPAVMTPEQLEGLRLFAPPELVTAPPLKFTRTATNKRGRNRQWPSYPNPA
jgi:hypothetical protein